MLADSILKHCRLCNMDSLHEDILCRIFAPILDQGVVIVCREWSVIVSKYLSADRVPAAWLAAIQSHPAPHQLPTACFAHMTIQQKTYLCRDISAATGRDNCHLLPRFVVPWQDITSYCYSSAEIIWLFSDLTLFTQYNIYDIYYEIFRQHRSFREYIYEKYPDAYDISHAVRNYRISRKRRADGALKYQFTINRAKYIDLITDLVFIQNGISIEQKRSFKRIFARADVAPITPD